MKVALNRNMDFLAGLMMIVVGGGAFYMALDFPFGSALRMGPGYFPRVLAGIFMLFGVFVLIRGLIAPVEVKGRWGFKPLAFITLGLVAFGYVMEHWGMLPALLVLYVVACGANHFYKVWEVLLMWALFSAFAVGVFIYGINLPYPLIGAH